MKQKLIDKISSLIKSKFFWRIAFLVGLIGIILVGFNISYNQKTGQFSCSKQEIPFKKEVK